MRATPLDPVPGSRSQRFDVVGSTNDVVRDWLADGTPEVCLAVADEQTRRSRSRRPALDRAGREPRSCCRSGSVRRGWSRTGCGSSRRSVSLAMADAAEEVAGLPDRTIRLKWPNDLVVEDGRRPRAGCARSRASSARPTGLGTDDPRVVVGIGLNADWAAADFPPELADTMTSLREASHGRPIDAIALHDGVHRPPEARVEALRGGRFDVADWTDRQLTTGRSRTDRGAGRRLGRRTALSASTR